MKRDVLSEIMCSYYRCLEKHPRSPESITVAVDVYGWLRRYLSQTVAKKPKGNLIEIYGMRIMIDPALPPGTFKIERPDDLYPVITLRSYCEN